VAVSPDSKMAGEIDKLIADLSIDRPSPATSSQPCSSSQQPRPNPLSATNLAEFQNSPDLIHREELVEFFKNLQKTSSNKAKGFVTVGLVGYPNVGKSSTINALLQTKKTQVSATPGKTKHFQTLFLDDEVQLCDCPGLVFPTFIASKADMVLNGVLPIDQLIDWQAPSTMLGQLIPRNTIESTYGFNIPSPKEGEDPSRPPTALELLGAYARMRGFFTSAGQPDCPRASRTVLKDFVKG